MNVISNILYWISTGLLVPVIVLLILFFIRALFMAGAFFGQYMEHKKITAPLSRRIESLTPATYASFKESLPASKGNQMALYSRRIVEAEGDAPRIDLLLSGYEIEATKELSSAQMLSKMGPILGLMGTLIPMGPALVGLAAGDIASMAYNMQVAFATTVVGLVVSAIGFMTKQVKERWSVKSMAVLEYLAELSKEEGKES